MLSPLQQALVRKALNENGFHSELPDIGDWLVGGATFASGRCFVTRLENESYLVATSEDGVSHALQLERRGAITLDLPLGAVAAFTAESPAALGPLIRRLYQLTRALPTTPWQQFEAQTRHLPATTETERIVHQRIGQDIFRAALLDYWDGACAVTGIDQIELLRASHIKPWSACSDVPRERLDVFNGFLLAADVDAAFDCGLVSFDENGTVLLSDNLTVLARARFSDLRIIDHSRFTAGHARYLGYHRAHVYQRLR